MFGTGSMVDGVKKRDMPGMCAMNRENAGWRTRNRLTGPAWMNRLKVLSAFVSLAVGATNREPITFPILAVVDRPLDFRCAPVLSAAPQSLRAGASPRDARGYTVPIPRRVSV